MKLHIASVFAAIIFFTMPVLSQKPLFTFGIIADVQYADTETAGTRFYRLSAGKLREAMNTFKSDSVSFVINLGDLIDRDFASFDPITDIIESSGIKTYHVTGNHDYSVDDRYKNKLPVLTPSKTTYYSVIYENYRFVFLNGNEISTYSTGNKKAIKKASENITSMKKNGEINAVEWNGGISSRQIEWLRNQLDESSSSGQKVFLLCHFPIFPENVHNLLNYKDVLALLENYNNIIAWFNGHNHAGNYGNFNMIHFVTFRGMVETESINSFARIDVFSNKIWIRGSGREKSQILAY